MTLLLERSWLGNEDATLERDLQDELPGVLNWALAGLSSLIEQSRFIRPRSTEEAFTALQDLASPVRAFIRDRCATGADHEVSVEALWTAWRDWAEDNGHGQGGSKQVFGRNLRAALPRVRLATAGDAVRSIGSIRESRSASRSNCDSTQEWGYSRVPRIPRAAHPSRTRGTRANGHSRSYSGGSVKPLLKAEQVAEILGVRTQYVYALARAGLPHIKVGRYVRFRAESIERWSEEQEEIERVRAQ